MGKIKMFLKYLYTFSAVIICLSIMLAYLALSFPVVYYFINVGLNTLMFLIWMATFVGILCFVLLTIRKKELDRRNTTISDRVCSSHQSFSLGFKNIFYS